MIYERRTLNMSDNMCADPILYLLDAPPWQEKLITTSSLLGYHRINMQQFVLSKRLLYYISGIHFSKNFPLLLEIKCCRKFSVETVFAKVLFNLFFPLPHIHYWTPPALLWLSKKWESRKLCFQITEKLQTLILSLIHLHAYSFYRL